MSISMTKADGVTVLTLTSDPQSLWPPMFQVLKALCYNPVCCTVSPHLRGVRGMSQSALGTLQIIVGLLSIGLGTILRCSEVYMYILYDTLYPIWLGILFIIFGITSILAVRYPSPCLVITNVILNLAGVAFAITAIVLYSISIGSAHIWWSCQRYNDYYWDRRTTPSTTPEDRRVLEACMEGRELTLMLIRSIAAVMVVLSTLELCVTISASVLGIKTLRSRGKGENESSVDQECYKPLLEEVATS